MRGYDHATTGRRNEGKVRKAIRTVMSRTTSKLEDESLVFMTLTKLWASQYHIFLAPTPQQSC